MNKQIEEMAKVIHKAKMNDIIAKVTVDIDDLIDCAPSNVVVAEALYKEGYRKHIEEGEWKETDYKTVEHCFVERRGKAWLCTNCRHASKEFNPNMNYCPNCGAKMKYESEGADDA